MIMALYFSKPPSITKDNRVVSSKGKQLFAHSRETCVTLVNAKEIHRLNNCKSRPLDSLKVKKCGFCK